jgi:RNA polymerase sigma-32 factor
MSIGYSDSGTSQYIDRVRAIPLLDRETEHDIAVRALAGDAEAKNALVRANLRFVVAIALSYRRYGIRIADLIAEGNLGLMIAAGKFDPERGTRFVTYAGYWIRALILDLIVRSSTMVGAGSGPLRSKLFFRLRRERARIGNLVPDVHERNAILAQQFETSEEKMEEMLRRLDARDVSLDQPVHPESGVTMLDALEDETSATPEQATALHESGGRVKERLHAALSRLDKRELYIVQQRYMGDEEVSLAEIGRELGVSRERARQLEARAKQKLREQLDDLAKDGLALDLVA